MRWQTTAAFAVLLVALAAFYYVYEIRLEPERQKAASVKGRILSVEPKDVAEVELKRPDGVVRLKREGESAWSIVEPVKGVGDRGATDEMLTSITTAKADREVASSPAQLADFGLDKPAAEVTLTLKDGKQVGLALGGKNPTGAWVYARETGKPAIVTISETILRDATRPVADFRDKTILAFDRRDVTGLEIATADGAIDVQAADGDRWKVTRPAALPADTNTVNDLLEKLQSSKVKAFVADAPRSLAPWGLDRPTRLTVNVGREKDKASKGLLFGRVDDEKKGVYAMRPGESSVLLLPDDVWKAVPRNVAAVRDKTVVAFDQSKVSRIDLDSPKGAVTLVRESDKWKITAPEALPADQPEAGGILFKLRELKALGFLSEDASGIAKYLRKPEVRVTLTAEGAPPKTLLLAPSPESRGGQPTAYAAIAGQGPVMLVEGRAAGDLARSVTELRDRTLVSGLEPREVKRVRIRRGDQTIVVERRGDLEWQMVQPEKATAKTAKVEDVLYGLRGLKWKAIAAARGEDAARYGLDAPSLEITLFKDKDAELATIQVGKRDGDTAYARTKASPAIYAIDSKLLEPPALADLKG